MTKLAPPCFHSIFAAAIFLLLIFVLPSWVLAQGKLGRVRKELRKESPKVESPKVAAPAERPSKTPKAKVTDTRKEVRGSNENRSNHADDRNNERLSNKPRAKVADARKEVRGRDRHRSNHSGNYNNGARINKHRPRRRHGYNPPRATAPVVVFHQTHGYFPAPSFSDAVIVAEPVIVADCPTLESNPRPTVAHPATLAAEPVPVAVPVEYEVVSEIDQVGIDWFEASDSRIWANVGSDFDGIFIGSLGANLQIPWFLGVDTSLAFLRERGMDWRDHLWLGDANVVYQIVNLPRLKTRVGVGANFMGDRWGSESGVNLTAGVDLKLNQRWTIMAEGDVGSLGDADFSHTKAALNRRFQGTNAQWTVGYERYSIGDVKIDSTFTGLQVRF